MNPLLARIVLLLVLGMLTLAAFVFFFFTLFQGRWFLFMIAGLLMIFGAVYFSKTIGSFFKQGKD
ncbi:hypothetical protein [Jeotgalibacillus soli]|uniref:Uncharacterized protein n=1 Tax=Jeotgalibacillus soli TaxID=889306 RepID=A0A0C2VA37_9BACL|nr:hypothetical protein [Jeotgalibacillus soli]KIL45832.1 hypothetical protein KP78_21810 [Jeotgalibacillus soli]